MCDGVKETCMQLQERDKENSEQMPGAVDEDICGDVTTCSRD